MGKNNKAIQTSSLSSLLSLIIFISLHVLSTSTTSAFWIHPQPTRLPTNHHHNHYSINHPNQKESLIARDSKNNYYPMRHYFGHFVSTTCRCIRPSTALMGRRRLYYEFYQNPITQMSSNSSMIKSRSTSSISPIRASIMTFGSNLQSSSVSASLRKRKFQSFQLFSSSKEGSSHNTIQNNEINDQDQQLLDQMRCHLGDEIFSKILDDDKHEGNKTSLPSPQSITILLAVSGGCDSIALFHFMLQLMKNNNSNNRTDSTESSRDCNKKELPVFTQRRVFEFNASPHHGRSKKINEATIHTAATTRTIECNIHVIHFDHQQRGEESDGDRIFVQKLCQENNIPFHCFYWNQYNDNNGDDNKNNNNNSNKNNKFSQEIARNWRRKKSLEVMEEIMSSSLHIAEDNKDIKKSISSKGVIFTAHHKDDAEETMIMKLLRGVHLTNWSGMYSLQRTMTESQHHHDLYLGKPMLCIRKKSIQNFLVRQGLEWREDKSNQSDKYLRNRVRHQLMPILQDLVGGEDVLGTRLENIEEQSRKIREDVSSRAQKYLDTSSTSSSSHFPLPIHKNSGNLSLVEEEALYQWIRKESLNAIAPSYDTISRISQQIMNFPERRQWRLNLGGEWYIKRNGDVLELESLEKNKLAGLNSDDHKEWKIMECNSGLSDPESNNEDIMSNEDENHLLSFSVKQQENGNTTSINFYLDTAGGNEKMRFTPPWRQEEASAGVKIKEFLRGQKIPLHRRGIAPIVCIEVDGIVHIGAVYIETSNKAKWIVNKMFKPDENDKEIVMLLTKRTA